MHIAANDSCVPGRFGVAPALLAGLLVVSATLNFGPLLGIADDANAIVTMLVGLALTLIHGHLFLGWKRLFVFLALTVAISFSAEALGVATGLLFGRYHYTDNLGPKILGVPVLIQVAYVAMGYASFVTARVILGAYDASRRGNLLPLTVCTALVMVAWDVAMDPYQSTIAGDWIWEDGGAYFGVPLHNYAGWFGTVAAFTFAYLLFESRNPLEPQENQSQGWFFHAAPVLYYALVGIGIVVTPVLERIDKVASPDTFTGSLESMTSSLSLITLFVMGTPVIFAVSRLVGVFGESRLPTGFVSRGADGMPGGAALGMRASS